MVFTGEPRPRFVKPSETVHGLMRAEGVYRENLTPNEFAILGSVATILNGEDAFKGDELIGYMNLEPAFVYPTLYRFEHSYLFLDGDYGKPRFGRVNHLPDDRIYYPTEFGKTVLRVFTD